jgi:GNAT superfamily N-acetyltransferase
MMSLGRSATRHLPAAPEAARDLAICEIRVLETVPELIESYRLRYDVYSTLGYIQRSIASKLEIDEYDRSSIPFGAFDPVSGTMIGTVRIIATETQPEYEYWIQGIADSLVDEELARRVSSPRPLRFPSIVSDQIHRQIEAFNTQRFAIYEQSRIIVRPGHRGLGISRGLMEFGLAYAAQFAPAVLIASCLPDHLPMYARYGYLKLPETDLDRFDSVGQIANAIICRTDVLPQLARAHIDELLHCMGSSATECTLDIGRGSCARYRFAPSRRARRRTMEW